MTLLLGKATAVMELVLLHEERGWILICGLLLREFGKRSKPVRIFSDKCKGYLVLWISQHVKWLLYV